MPRQIRLYQKEGELTAPLPTPLNVSVSENLCGNGACTDLLTYSGSVVENSCRLEVECRLQIR